LTKSPRTALIAQNHCSGIRALFDDGPAPIPVGSAVNDEPQNVNVTNVNRTRDVPDVAAFHLLANLDRVIDRIRAGRAEITWKVAGTAGATPFELSGRTASPTPRTSRSCPPTSCSSTCSR
jgi:hypothetical protein